MSSTGHRLLPICEIEQDLNLYKIKSRLVEELKNNLTCLNDYFPKEISSLITSYVSPFEFWTEEGKAIIGNSGQSCHEFEGILFIKFIPKSNPNNTYMRFFYKGNLCIWVKNLHVRHYGVKINLGKKMLELFPELDPSLSKIKLISN